MFERSLSQIRVSKYDLLFSELSQIKGCSIDIDAHLYFRIRH
jgi:hypothetical protein